ncbi:DUF1990 family protein [Streptomyces sp. NPDC085946]|uniref:DUF1990 family protein n=1 Tax=Streptomyces sp. NPDC085946 TaxID=3365744 RepID=UPI0037D14974
MTDDDGATGPRRAAPGHPHGDLSYGTPGATSPGALIWPRTPSGFRRFERTVPIGRGEHVWTAAARAVARWEVKTRSGFTVTADDGADAAVRRGGRYTVTAGLGPLAVREPVEVVAVVGTPDRCGFAYGTRHGHPVSGEEAFVVHRDHEGRVFLTLRSLTRAAPAGPWRLAFPLLLLAQRRVRGRYLRALP